ncbi:MAG: asparaginase [Firmicutes bacterium]|nr:asparaginase [Bacillota bacterium]
MPAKPGVLIVSTGGTILSRSTGSEGYKPAVTGAELVGSIPGLLERADVQVLEFSSVLSFALDPDTVVHLMKTVQDRLAGDETAGAVVIQGTATMEETAYLADLLHSSDKPVVFTGAMYSASEPDSDGPRNVLYSVIVATSEYARGKGVVVCMNGEVHAARDVVKTHKSDVGAFKSPNLGPIGLVSKTGVVFYRAPLFRRAFSDGVEPRVDLVKVVLGSDARLLKASVDSGARGVVIEAFPGNGGVTPSMMAAVEELRARDFPIVMAPRSIGGRTSPGAGGGCGPADLARCGVILAGDLPAQKARILLMVALATCRTTAEIGAVFASLAP